MFREAKMIAAVAIFLAAVGCGAEQEQASEEAARTPDETTGGETRLVEETTVIEDTTTERTAPDMVSVGGYSVERPDGRETTVPEVTAEREEVQRYQQQIQPVIEATVREVSDLVQTDVRLENGNLSLDVDIASLEEARASVREGLERLQEIDPPEDLEPVHQRLMEAYEQVLSAYNEIIEAAESGDPQRMSAAAGENLPRIERFNEETGAILQDLEEAAASQQ